MKKFLIASLILFGFVLLLFVFRIFSSPHRHLKPIKLATIDWAPYVGEELPEDGPIAKIVTESIIRMGLQPEFTYVSNELALEQTRNTDVFGTFPWRADSARAQVFNFSEPLINFEYVLFYYKPGHTNPEAYFQPDYRDTIIFGIVDGYTIWPTLQKAINQYPHFQIDTSLTTANAAFQALKSGEIDFLPEGLLAGLTILNGEQLIADKNDFGWLDSEKDSVFGINTSLRLLMPKGTGSENFIEEFNLALVDVKKTTFYKNIAQSLKDMKTTLIVDSISAPFKAELTPMQGEEYIWVHPDDSRQDRILVPRGTIAMVIDWPSTYWKMKKETENGPFHCRIKILNGPLTGRIALVDTRAIVLTSN